MILLSNGNNMDLIGMDYFHYSKRVSSLTAADWARYESTDRSAFSPRGGECEISQRLPEALRMLIEQLNAKTRASCRFMLQERRKSHFNKCTLNSTPFFQLQPTAMLYVR